MTDWDISKLEWDFSWLEGVNKSCPFCNAKMENTPGTTNNGVAKAECECGYSAIFTPPDDLDPGKGVPVEIVL